MGPVLSHLKNFVQIDVTPADEDNNWIPTDDINRPIIGNVAMQVAPPGGQTCN